MAEENIQSHLDRFLRERPLIVAEHEDFRAQCEVLLRSQLVEKESLEPLRRKVKSPGEKIDRVFGQADRGHGLNEREEPGR